MLWNWKPFTARNLLIKNDSLSI